MNLKLFVKGAPGMTDFWAYYRAECKAVDDRGRLAVVEEIATDADGAEYPGSEFHVVPYDCLTYPAN